MAFTNNIPVYVCKVCFVSVKLTLVLQSLLRDNALVSHARDITARIFPFYPAEQLNVLDYFRSYCITRVVQVVASPSIFTCYLYMYVIRKECP